MGGWGRRTEDGFRDVSGLCSNKPTAHAIQSVSQAHFGNRYIKAFIPVYDDWFRSRRSFLSGEGGNLATVEELQQLSHHPEVHVLSCDDTSDDGDVSAAAAANGGVSNQVREVLQNGSTAVNFLVWRRSMLRVCMIVLSVSMLVQLSALKSALVGDQEADNSSGRDGDPDPFEVVADCENSTNTHARARARVHTHTNKQTYKRINRMSAFAISIV